MNFNMCTRILVQISLIYWNSLKFHKLQSISLENLVISLKRRRLFIEPCDRRIENNNTIIDTVQIIYVRNWFVMLRFFGKDDGSRGNHHRQNSHGQCWKEKYIFGLLRYEKLGFIYADHTLFCRAPPLLLVLYFFYVPRITSEWALSSTNIDLLRLSGSCFTSEYVPQKA